MHFSDSFTDSLGSWRYNDRCVVSRLLTYGFTTCAFADYITIRGGELSYLPAKKIPSPLPEDFRPWSRAERQTGSAGRIVRKLLSPETLERVSSSDIEAFANRVKATHAASTGGFRLVSGEEIRYWYLRDRSAPGTGSLRESCMGGSVCQPFFDLYVKNPDKVRMLILVNANDLLVGRALIWTLDDGDTFMDRIYGNDAVIAAFCNYAHTQGWIRKHYQNYETPMDVVLPNGDTDCREMAVSLSLTAFTTYPYLDTMKYLEQGFGLRNISDEGYDLCLTDTEGNVTTIECRHCDFESSSEDDFSSLNSRSGHFCRDCYDSFHCTECNEEMSWPRASGYCRSCESSHTCNECGDTFHSLTNGLCDDCQLIEHVA